MRYIKHQEPIKSTCYPLATDAVGGPGQPLSILTDAPIKRQSLGFC